MYISEKTRKLFKDKRIELGLSNFDVQVKCGVRPSVIENTKDGTTVDKFVKYMEVLGLKLTTTDNVPLSTAYYSKLCPRVKYQTKDRNLIVVLREYKLHGIDVYVEGELLH